MVFINILMPILLDIVESDSSYINLDRFFTTLRISNVLRPTLELFLNVLSLLHFTARKVNLKF